MIRDNRPHNHLAAARTDYHGVTIATLANGLKVIIKEDPRTPVAICHVWVRVGSNREPDHLRGWSHGIEHMVFKGTERRAEADFAKEVAGAGGTTNAGTGYETTSYHILVPKENLPRALDILSDALFHTSFTPQSLDAERKVLVHENHMYDDIPYGFGITWRWGMELAFESSPYRYPIGGRDKKLLETARSEILSYYRTAYQPDNMTAVVVGDTSTEKILGQLEHYFGKIPAGSEPSLTTPPSEPIQRGLRYRLMRGDLQKAYAKLIFPAISERDPARPTLSVVRRILSDGRSCRLYRTVQEEKQLVSDISILTETGPREGVILFDLETDTTKLLAAVQAVVEVLEDLRSQPPGEDELDRAKIRVERSFLFSAETVQGQSSTIGYYDAMGDLEGAFLFPQRVRSVTGDDVTRFCQRVFRRGNLNVLLYVPKTADPAAVGLPADAGTLDQVLSPFLGDETPTPSPTLSGAPAAAATPSLQSPPATAVLPPATASKMDPVATAAGKPATQIFQKTVLDSGLSVYMRVDRTLPVFTLGLYVKGGVCVERREQAGLSSLMHKVQVKGTTGKNAEQIHSDIEGLGASLSPLADRDFGGLYLSGLTRHLEPALTWLGRLACAPTFAAEELERERKLALDQLEALADDPLQCTARVLRETIYGSHPYGYPLTGREESLPTLTRSDLSQHHQNIWVPENIALVASGDLNPEQLVERLTEVFSELHPGRPPQLPFLALEHLPRERVQKRLTRDFHQAVVFVAWRGPTSPDENRADLLLMKELLNGQSGRLFDALRNKRSLCYNTGIQSTAGFGPGMIAAFVLTDPEREEEALSALLNELEGITQQEASPSEFDRARAKLTGNLLITSQSNAARVHRCARDVMYDRDPNNLPNLLDQIAACTPRTVRDTAEHYFSVPQRFEIILGPGESHRE